MNAMTRTSLLLGLIVNLGACARREKPRTAPGADPIAPEKLAELLPKLDGWTVQTEAKGQTVDGRRLSLATGTYTKPGEGNTATVTVEFVDSNGASGVFAPFALMSHSQGEGFDVHKRTLQREGNPGLEVWDPATGGVTAMLIAAGRFRVTLKGSHVPRETVDQYLSAIDFKQFAAWAPPKP